MRYRSTAPLRLERLESRQLLSVVSGDESTLLAPEISSENTLSAHDDAAAANEHDDGHGQSTSDGFLRTHFDRVPDFGQFPTVRSVQGGLWSDPSTWEGGVVPGEGDIVEISAGDIVKYDRVSDVAVETVAIHGKLRFLENRDTRLTVVNLLVYEDGVLQIGSAEKPIRDANTAEVVFADQPFDLVAHPDNPDPEQWGHGLVAFGKVEVHGGVKSDSFVRLDAEPMAGDLTLELAEPVTGWRAGDWVLLPDTRQFSQADFADLWADGQWEQAQIASVSTDGRTITLAGSDGLEFDHLGATDGEGNLDFLPHVANLTRNVILRSENPDGTRGHTAYLSRADVDIRYAQFSDMGRTLAQEIDNTVLDPNTEEPLHIGTNQIARYALHTHHLIGPEQPQENGRQVTIIGNVIENGDEDHNFKWGLVIHNTHYGLFEQNVVYNTGGAGISGEDGSESENIVAENFTVRTFIGTEGKEGQPLGGVNNDERGDVGAGLWFHGPNNYLRDNVAANSYTAGVVINSAGLSTIKIPAFQGEDHHAPGGGQEVEIRAFPLAEFSGNEVYGGTRMGASIWGIGGRSDFLWDVDTSVVEDLTVWHPSQAALEFWRIHRFVFDGLVLRGDFDSINDPNGPTGLSVRATHYPTRSLTFQNADVQGFNVAIGELPTFLISDEVDEAFLNENSPPEDYYPVADGEPGELFFVDSYFRNQTNIVIRTPEGSVPDYAGTQRIEIRNVRFDPVDAGDPDERDIVLDYWPRNLAGSGRDVTMPMEVVVYDYNGQAGEDFQVLFHEQAPFFEVPLSGSRSSLTGTIEAGLTNQESFDRYGVAVGGSVATTSDTLPRIGGLVAALPGDSPLGLSAQPPVIFLPEIARSIDRRAAFVSHSGDPQSGLYQVTFQWYTNVPAQSRVEETSGKFAAVEDTALKNVHSLVVDGLEPGEQINYRLLATDAEGQTTISQDYPFTIPDDSSDTDPPAITNLGDQAIFATDSTVTISWTTDELADSQIEFGLTSQYGSVSDLSDVLTGEHYVQITDLAPGTTYHIRAVSTDAAGNRAESADHVFTTASNPAPQTQLYGPEISNAGETQRFVVAATDVPSYSTSQYLVDWGDGSDIESAFLRNGAALEHVYALGGSYEISMAAITPVGLAIGVSHEIVVVGQTDPNLVAAQLVPQPDTGLVDLVVTGTAGDDVIGFLPSIDDQIVMLVPVENSVTTDRVEAFSGVTGSIIVDVGDGDDAVIADLLQLPVEIFGGSGSDFIIGSRVDDHIEGGGDHDVLFGGIYAGDGDDFIDGGDGRDIVVGGAGADLLVGADGDDLLVAGSLIADNLVEAALAIAAEWFSGNDYETRIDHLTNGGGANGSFTLTPGDTITDESPLDALHGDADLDWFLASLLNDLILGIEAEEQVLDTGA